MWKNFVATAMAQGLVDLRGADPETLLEASFRGPTLPWIDPLKEMEGFGKQIEFRLASRHSIIRQMGGDPQATDKEIAADPWPEEYGKDGLQQQEEKVEAEPKAEEETVTEEAA